MYSHVTTPTMTSPLLGDTTKVKNAKLAVYTCPFDAMNTETKGTVLIKSAEELKTFSKGEEELIESVRLKGGGTFILLLEYCLVLLELSMAKA